MAERLKDKVAFVTGGASGIGAAVVRAFVREGARVGVMDVSEPGLRALSSELGDAVLPIPGDAASRDDNDAAVRAVAERWGRLNVFVGNAGVFDGFASLEAIPEAALERAYREVFDVNVFGYLLGAKAALPHLRASPGGAIILTASSASFHANSGGILYMASKHAVLGVIKQLAFELAPAIRVNGVSPGGTVTGIRPVPALRETVPEVGPEARADRMRRRNPLRLVMTPEDHVEAYLLLASDASRAITGAVIESDGGIAVRGVPFIE